MTDAARVFSILWISRPARVVADISLMIAALFLFAKIQAISESHSSTNETQTRARQAVKINKAPPVNIAKPEFVTQRHESEPAMWDAFSKLRHEMASGSGNCRFTGPALSATAKFELMCVVYMKEKVPNTPNAASGKTLQEQNEEGLLHHVFARTAQPHTVLPALEPQANMVVQGWMDTSSGRKLFDSKNNRWIP